MTSTQPVEPSSRTVEERERGRRSKERRDREEKARRERERIEQERKERARRERKRPHEEESRPASRKSSKKEEPQNRKVSRGDIWSPTPTSACLSLSFAHWASFVRQREEQEEQEFPFNMSDFVTVDEVGDVTDLPGSPCPVAKATPSPRLSHTHKVNADVPVWVFPRLISPPLV